MEAMGGMTGTALPMVSESGVGAGIDPFSGGFGAGLGGEFAGAPLPAADAGGALVAPAGAPAPMTFPIGGEPTGGFNPASLVKALPALIGGGNQLVNMFRSSPTEKLLASGQQQMRGISKATGQAGKSQLNQYVSGNLSDPQKAAVERFKQQQRAYWNQYFAKAGIPVSSAMAEIEGKIEQDAQVYANQLLQQNFENSMKSLGLANNSLVSQSYINAGLNSQIANSQAQAAEAIAKMAGIFFPGQTQ